MMMNFHDRRPCIWTISLLFLQLFTLVGGAQEEKPVPKEKAGPMVRFLCVSSLSDTEELVLVSKGEDGEWVEYGEVTLRSSFISAWIQVASRNLSLARREGDGYAPVCSFSLKSGSKRSVAVLLPNPAKKTYQANVIDPAKLGFRKGMTLVTNYSKVPALVMFGNKRTEVLPGKQVAARVGAGEDGMYRMLVGYQGKDKKLVPCYDRYLAANPEAREFLMLFPDATTGLRVFSLSEFGPFE